MREDLYIVKDKQLKELKKKYGNDIRFYTGYRDKIKFSLKPSYTKKLNKFTKRWAQKNIKSFALIKDDQKGFHYYHTRSYTELKRHLKEAFESYKNPPLSVLISEEISKINTDIKINFPKNSRWKDASISWAKKYPGHTVTVNINGEKVSLHSSSKYQGRKVLSLADPNAIEGISKTAVEMLEFCWLAARISDFTVNPKAEIKDLRKLYKVINDFNNS